MSQTNQHYQTEVVIIGAGPAGLTAAYELSKLGKSAIILEKAPLVGGISRTETYRGYRLDVGGHRFFTQVPAVAALWREVLATDLLRRPRLSRIYYNHQFFPYPIRLGETLKKLGLVESLHIFLSYLYAQLRPYPQEQNFEQWVSNRFGRRLFEIFFKTYTEKVWGLSCREITAEWAAQRIKGLSLAAAVKNALGAPQSKGITSLIEAFDYPRQGPGMLWERVQSLVEATGHQVLQKTDVVELRLTDRRVVTVVAESPTGQLTISGQQVISSMPLPELIRKIRPAPPPEISRVAQRLTFRDFLTVALIINRAHLFPDNWLYIHSPAVRVGRIQNFKNWSPAMLPPRATHTTCLGLEYFCSCQDELWHQSDAELIALATQELQQIGLVNPAEVIDGTVIRQPKAYPIYTGEYKIYLALIKQYIQALDNLQTIGRNGLHQYNNQDHSMLTAMLAIKNLGGEQYDLWTVNTERSYHEEMQLMKG